jgi:hypothetical protein
MDEHQETTLIWLTKKYFDEWSLQFRTTWDLYLKFYVIFLSINITALGLTVQSVHSIRAKAVIAIVFIVQNALAGSTAVMIAIYSSKAASRAQDLAVFALANATSPAPVPLPAVFGESPIPGSLGRWGGFANLCGHIVFGLLWVLVIFVNFSDQTIASR